MKVSLLPPSIYIAKNYAMSPINKTNVPNNKTVVSFGKEPWILDPLDLNISRYGSLDHEDAIKLYKKLACGNYLDIGDDKLYPTYCKSIRANNLAFLDRVTDINSKSKFISYYKTLTGFPNLQTVSNKIEQEFVNALKKTENDLYYSKYKIVQAGYDGVCSVAQKRALPGSDLDKAYVIIQGTGNPYEDEECVNMFKGGIWKNTDQRILSYNHGDDAFPQVYTVAQFKKIFNAAENTAQNYWANRNYHNSRFGYNNYYDSGYNTINKLRNQLNRYTTDYVAANEFYIKVCQNIPNTEIDGVSREKVKNLGFILEVMREGKKFKEFGSIYMPNMESSLIYKLTNLSQIKALKTLNDDKPKRLARINLNSNFNSWTINKQYDFIKTLIQSSCTDYPPVTHEFAKYFTKPGEDLFEPLNKALMEG